MPRKSTGPRFYDSKNAFFATIRGERTRLCDGPDNEAQRRIAQDRYDNLMAVKRTEVEGDRSPAWAVLDAYLQHARTRTSPPPMAPATYQLTERACRDFCELYGTVRVRDLRPKHFQDWLSRRKETERVYERTGRRSKWNDETAKLMLRRIISAFRWAATDGELISASPFTRRGQRTPWPDANHLARKLAVTDEEHLALCAQADRRADKGFLILLQCLYHTGARPAEVYMATASEWDPALQAFVIDPNDPANIGRLKTRHSLRKHGRKRIIRIPDVLVGPLQELMRRYPEGPIFRMEKLGNKPWARDRIAARFKSLVMTANRVARRQKEKGAPGHPVREKLILYSYRHSFVTRWLMAGRSPMTLCELLNTSLEMLRRHYSHLFEQHDFLLGELNTFSRAQVGGRAGCDPRTVPFSRAAGIPAAKPEQKGGVAPEAG